MTTDFKTDLFAMLQKADDEMLWLVYCLLLKFVKSNDQMAIPKIYQASVFLEKLKKVQEKTPFQQIQDSLSWQKQQRDEWE